MRLGTTAKHTAHACGMSPRDRYNAAAMAGKTINPHLFDLDPDALRQLLVEWELPPFRADQVLDWVYHKGVADPQAMTNLSNSDRNLLAARVDFLTGKVVTHQHATDDTQKLLIAWPASLPSKSDPDRADSDQSDSDLADSPAKKPGSSTNDATISLPVAPVAPVAPELPDVQTAKQSVGQTAGQTESVMIPADDRRTACISSQIGCPVGCTFCASGLDGLDANLTAGQIVEQVWLLNQLPQVERITNVVFMGMGEPLANFDAVAKALTHLMADWGFGISGRRITISTVGLPAPIRRLADLKLPVTLAISLHAPNDTLRKRLIPWAEYVSIDQLIEAGRYYFDRTGREITLEYILLHEVNDQPTHAQELAKVAKQLRSNVNLIRYNEVAGLPFSRPNTENVSAFQQILRGAGVNTHIRASRGRDIAAACGQLRQEQASS